jgi:CheY-like chemotaxis protein
VANVLVVDDDDDARRVLHRMLVKLGHQTRIVADGAEALQLLEESRFDLVITDVYMASVDGMELLVRIRQRGLDVPVLAISGGGYLAADDLLALARACGAAATLGKPFTPEELRDAIEPVLRLGRGR